MVSTLVIQVGWIGRLSWRGWQLGCTITDTLLTKWSHVNHRSGADQGKSASQRPTSWPLSLVWMCTVYRMDNENCVKKLLNAVKVYGHRSGGRQQKRWIDNDTYNRIIWRIELKQEDAGDWCKMEKNPRGWPVFRSSLNEKECSVDVLIVSGCVIGASEW